MRRGSKQHSKSRIGCLLARALSPDRMWRSPMTSRTRLRSFRLLRVRRSPQRPLTLFPRGSGTPTSRGPSSWPAESPRRTQASWFRWCRSVRGCGFGRWNSDCSRLSIRAARESVPSKVSLVVVFLKNWAKLISSGISGFNLSNPSLPVSEPWTRTRGKFGQNIFCFQRTESLLVEHETVESLDSQKPGSAPSERSDHELATKYCILPSLHWSNPKSGSSNAPI